MGAHWAINLAGFRAVSYEITRSCVVGYSRFNIPKPKDSLSKLDSQRPDTITYLGTLEVLLSILACLGLVALALINDVVSVMFGVFSVLVLFWLVSGLGFLYGRRWAWSVGIASSVLSFASSLFLSFFTVLGPVFAPGLVFWPAAIYLLTRPALKTFFTRK